MRFLLFLIIASIASVAGYSQTGPGAMLPGKDDVPGWRTAGEIKIWSKENIRNFAKEESDLVMEYGFDHAVEQDYYNYRNKLIKAKVYVMTSSFGACGLFMRYSKNQKVIKEYGNSAYQKVGEYGFWKHLYLVKLTSASAGDTITDGFRMIAAYIDSKIRSKGMIPEILGLSGGKAGNVTIFKGPLALSEIYYFSPLNIFFVQEGIAIENGDTKDIILKYSDNNEAVRRFTEVAGLLSGMNKFSDFIMLENFSFALKDRDRKTLVFKVSENYLKINIKK
jgi:hypothetical protein